ncbi:MAG: D-alanine--D-alanine ligase [Chlamydiota bacterium]|jgi:D-alanine-D-alanine ligase
MTHKKLRVGVLFGGKSAEHEISLVSAKNIIETLDKNKYDVVLIGIDKQGSWRLQQAGSYLLNETTPSSIALTESKEIAPLTPSQDNPLQLDVIFPVLHGPYGEDGSVQGFLKLANVPFVGADILGSAIGMDKDITKRLLRDAGIPIAPFAVIYRHEKNGWSFERAEKAFGAPFFIKPAGLGSSVGVAKVTSEEEFTQALDNAFLYDRKVLIEKFVRGRELVCAVLGNEHPIASLPGEIVPHHAFYSYAAKYLDEKGATYHIPANISSECASSIQKMSIQVYKTLCCEGMARIDFFLSEKEELFVNELNSIPGFTRFSTYPRLWEATGLPCSQLLDRLIELALLRHRAIADLSSCVLFKDH